MVEKTAKNKWSHLGDNWEEKSATVCLGKGCGGITGVGHGISDERPWALEKKKKRPVAHGEGRSWGRKGAKGGKENQHWGGEPLGGGGMKEWLGTVRGRTGLSIVAKRAGNPGM